MSDTNGTRGSTIRFISWNVKGMNGPNKRARIFAHLKKMNTEIAFLQETHLQLADHMRLRKPWIGQAFHSQFNSKARGTAILIHKKVQFHTSKFVSDPQGCFVIVTGQLFHSPVALVCVYAPNWDDVNFIHKIFSLLPDLNTHRLIFGGDLNCVINPVLDRSNPKTTSQSKMSQALSAFMTQTGCVDPWRFLFPQKKEFSYFSLVHSSYSRIYYFFIDKTLLPSVEKTPYSTIIISDHAPLLLDLRFSHYCTQRPTWRFNSNLLADKNFHKHISVAIDNFLLTNVSEEISPLTLWETFKVVIRGEIISYSISINKVKHAKLQQLINSIEKLDQQLSILTSEDLLKKRVEIKAQYDQLSIEKTQQNLLWSKGNFYEHGEKASRLLSYQIKTQSASRLIPQIRNASQQLTVDPTEINDTFKKYYTDLYTSNFSGDISDVSFFE